VPSAGTMSQGQTCWPASEPGFELSRLDLPLELLPDCLSVFPGVGLRYEPITDSVAAIEALIVANEHGARTSLIELEQQRVGHGESLAVDSLAKRGGVTLSKVSHSPRAGPPSPQACLTHSRGWDPVPKSSPGRSFEVSGRDPLTP
jgi:hypothetical protein